MAMGRLRPGPWGSGGWCVMPGQDVLDRLRLPGPQHYKLCPRERLSAFRFGRETWTIPPSGGISWAQVQRDRTLHLGNARVPPGSPAVEGSEDGGVGRAASGRKRGHPRLRQLLIHHREKRHRSKPIIQPRGLGTGRSVDL